MPLRPSALSPTASIASLVPSPPPSFTLLYASHAHWPLPPRLGSSSEFLSPRLLRISVLDSSYNPPHAAHLALAKHGAKSADATLLAFTISNPDKGAVTLDSGLLHRLEMIRAVALDLQEKAAEEGLRNVAVAVLNAPTFTQKSRILRSELDALVREQSGEEKAEVRCSFAVGWDTLIRIFAPRYYQTGPGLPTSMNAFLIEDGSSVSCARRGDIPADEERAFLDSDEVKPWRSQVELFDLEDEKVKGISSTAIREAVKEERWEDVRRDVPFEGVVEILRRERLYRD
ncbi:hypothetical protein JCM8097_002151 [Rhodosporidiobolus ruineniae]